MTGKWQELQIEQIADEMGDAPFGSDLKNTDYTTDGALVVQGKNIQGRITDWRDRRYVSLEKYATLPRSHCKIGDLLFPKVGTIGKIGVLTPCVGVTKYVLSTNTMRLRPDETIANKDFVYYYFSWQKTRDLINALNSKSVQPVFNFGSLKKFTITLPPLREQQAIAAILGALDDKIELNRRMNETLEGMARALFKSWFVDFDPVRAKAAGREPHGLKPEIAALFPAAFEDSELGEIPQGWEVKALYDTATYVNGASFRSEHFCDSTEGLPVIKIAELKSGIDDQTKYTNRTDLDSKYYIDTGELLYSWSGSPDTSLDAFLWTCGPGVLNQHIFRVITQTNVQKHFVFYLLKHLRPTLIEIARNKQTTGLGHVTVADMKRFNVSWPSDQIFNVFERIIGPIFDRAFAATIEKETLAALRDTLLPKLISGELRVPDAERIVGRVV